MRQYKVEALVYYTKLTTDKEHIIKSSTVDLQEKLDEYARRGRARARFSRGMSPCKVLPEGPRTGVGRARCDRQRTSAGPPPPAGTHGCETA